MVKFLSDVKILLVFIVLVLYSLMRYQKSKIKNLKVQLKSQLAINEANDKLSKISEEINRQSVNERENIKSRNYFDNRKDL